MTLAQSIAALASPAVVEGRIGIKVQSTNRDKSKGMVVAFIDARTVASALDKHVGSDGWSTEVTDGPTLVEGPDRNGVVRSLGYRARMRLTLTDGTGFVSREDTGYNALTGASPDHGTASKGAVSDALKRAAAQFGVGRALYDLPQAWVRLNDRGYPADEREVAQVLARWNSLLHNEETPPMQGAPEEDDAPRATADARTPTATPTAAPTEPAAREQAARPPDQRGAQPPTEKQLGLLRRLVKQEGRAELDAMLQQHGVGSESELPRRVVSALINNLTGGGRRGDPTAQPPRAAPATNGGGELGDPGPVERPPADAYDDIPF